MLVSEMQPALRPVEPQSLFVMKARSNSISTSHLSLKSAELNNELKAMSESLQIPAEDIQLDIPIREIAKEQIRSKLSFEDLPVEVHECILDHIFGIRASTASTSTPGKSSAVRGWSSILRHPRRKALSDLALVSSTWRPLVQERLFRHIKIRGTHDGLSEVADFFKQRQRFLPYVKHVEVWIPVWGNRAIPTSSLPQTLLDQDPTRAVVTTAVDGSNTRFEESNNGNVVYSLASHNASLEEIFKMAISFTHARILTVEGGHCKKPPKVQHFRWRSAGSRPADLPVNPNITTLVLRGAWNIMRNAEDYCNITCAFPNVREWHCSYAKPKLEAYQTIHSALNVLPHRLTHLNITIDGFYNKAPGPGNLNPLLNDYHLCAHLGRQAATLEALSFTGRCCSSFFASMRRNVPSTGSRLRSLDLNVKNCCRSVCKSTATTPVSTGPHNITPVTNLAAGPSLNFPSTTTTTTLLTHDVHTPPSITNYSFILAFESLVHSSIISLPVLSSLNFIRIRFIDLDSLCPLLNPYFQLKDGECTGLWSDQILYALTESRPEIGFVSLAEGIEFGKGEVLNPEGGSDGGAMVGGGDGVADVEGVALQWPKSRPIAMKASAFKGLAEGLKV